MISRDMIFESVEYFPETGIFKTKKAWGSMRKVGDTVGTVSKSTGYVSVAINGRNYWAHRIAIIYMDGQIPSGMQVDHINGDRTDNRYKNLRIVSQIENRKNSAIRRDNSSGISGVNLDISRNKWAAFIYSDNKTISLGRFTSFFDACCARKSAENYYGFHANHGRKHT